MDNYSSSPTSFLLQVRRNPGFQRVPPAMQAAALVNGTNLSLTNHVNFASNPLGFETVNFPGLWRDPHEATYYLNYNVPPERLVSAWNYSGSACCCLQCRGG